MGFPKAKLETGSCARDLLEELLGGMNGEVREKERPGKGRKLKYPEQVPTRIFRIQMTPTVNPTSGKDPGLFCIKPSLAAGQGGARFHDIPG